MKNLIFIGISLIALGCTSGNTLSENEFQEDQDLSFWSIPFQEVLDGGPGKDGIPSIDSPRFVTPSEAFFLKDDDLVVGISLNGDVKAYPHKILDYHEIVNDVVGQIPMAISYCPLTGTAFAWNRIIKGKQTTFGVSGLLYNTNLILYDRDTQSNWAQLELECVNGQQLGTKPILSGLVETDWATWKTLYPNSKVMSLETGFTRDYDQYPYGGYKTNNDMFIFPATPSNDALPNKERVYTIIKNQKAKVYQFKKFSGGKIFKEIFNGATYLVVGNDNTINAFLLTDEEVNLDYEYIGLSEDALFKASNGNEYSVFGEVLTGPNQGSSMEISPGVVSFWFAVAAFYPNPEIYVE